MFISNKSLFTKPELAWLEQLEKTLATAPPTIGKKLGAYTIGDSNITLYDKAKLQEFCKDDLRWNDKDMPGLVAESQSYCLYVEFPFQIDSAAG